METCPPQYPSPVPVFSVCVCREEGGQEKEGGREVGERESVSERDSLVVDSTCSGNRLSTLNPTQPFTSFFGYLSSLNNDSLFFLV